MQPGWASGCCPDSSPCLAWILPSALLLGSGPTQGAGRHPLWLCDSLEFSQVGAGPACLPWCLPSVQTPILRLVTLWDPDHCVSFCPPPVGAGFRVPSSQGEPGTACPSRWRWNVGRRRSCWGGEDGHRLRVLPGGTLSLAMCQVQSQSSGRDGAPGSGPVSLGWRGQGWVMGCPHWCSPGSLPPALLFQTLFVSTLVLES